MISIRRIFDDAVPVDRQAIAQVLAIWREQFPDVAEADLDAFTGQLSDPFQQSFRRILFVAEKRRHEVRGFAIVLHAPAENFLFLEYVAAAAGQTGGGLGAALYQRVREEGVELGVVGVFLECSPDDPEACPDPEVRAVNARRLKFYEDFGVRPLIGNRYDAPIKPSDTEMPLLCYDDLGSERPLQRRDARQVVQAILARKYGKLCPPAYIRRVVGSFTDDPAPLRPPRYFRNEHHRPGKASSRHPETKVALTVNDKHDIHHVRERGYVESPARIGAILRGFENTDLLEPIRVKKHGMRHIKAVHDPAFVDYLRRVCEGIPEGTSVYPYVFPIRNQSRAPKELAVRAGYYCIDTFTPLNRNAYVAARRAVDCGLTAADAILGVRRFAYALVRPPGHHAERATFGGFCYFNTAAVCAHYLATHGKVAILDIDYHHGNGQQDIFYHRADVLTVSLHGHPRFAYPYFSGFDDERGEGEGEGFNVNVPLPERLDGKQFRKALAPQLQRIVDFDPTVLVIAIGFDPGKGDPTGTWSLRPQDFHENGKMIGKLRMRTLIIQEGGYRTLTLGANARFFFEGLVEGLHA